MKVHNGDLFAIVNKITDKNIMIVHQCNCQNKIGAGFAEQFIKNYPQIEKAYYDFCAKTPKDERLGKMSYVQLKPNLVGINLMTQFKYGNAARNKTIYTDMPLLIDRLKKLSAFATSKNAVLVAPYGIGCGYSGGNWEELSAALKDTKIVFFRK